MLNGVDEQSPLVHLTGPCYQHAYARVSALREYAAPATAEVTSPLCRAVLLGISYRIKQLLICLV